MHIHAMTELKERRQKALAEVIRSGPRASQDELCEQLAGLGFTVTQATISRDLDQIGAVRVRRDGKLGYVLPDNGAASGSRLATVFRDFVRSIDPAGNLVVIKTPPGSAHLVGVVLDEASLPQIVGTICGDDTIFIACTTTAAASALTEELRAASA
jgi:transcriptional regulator of arginine metabolism